MKRNLDRQELFEFLSESKKKKDSNDNHSIKATAYGSYGSDPLIIKPINYLYKQKVAKQKAMRVKEKAKYDEVLKAELEIKHAKKRLHHQYRLHHQLDSMPKSTPQPPTKAKSNPVKNTRHITNTKKPALSKQNKAKITKINQDIQAINAKRQAIRNQDTHNLLDQIGFGNVINHDNQNPLMKKHTLSKHKTLLVARKKKIRNNNRSNPNNPFKHPFSNGGFSR